MRPALALLLPASLLIALPALRADAAAITSMRLASVTKADATLSMDLDAPAPVSVSWGENPGAWIGTADATSSTDHHELKMTGLSPDARYYYQVSVEGVPQAEMLTFLSGRSWVTRRAAILVTADATQGAPDETALADRLFAEEADALIVLGGDAGHPVEFAKIHGRSMAEKVVVAADGSSPMNLPVADVRVVSSGPLPGDDDGTCWRVALGADGPKGADVIVTTGTAPSLMADIDALRVVLSDPETSGGPRAYVRLDFVEGRLDATLRSATGETLALATYRRECHAPKPAPAPAHAASSGDGDGEGDAGSSEGELRSDDCDAP